MPMLVTNALRAKIIARMFSVIKRNEFYSPISQLKNLQNHKNMVAFISVALFSPKAL